MGLLDSIGGMLGGEASHMSQLPAIMSWVEQQGGIQGIIEKFHNGGLAEIIQSWIGQGANLPISAEQIVSVFGSPALQGLADKLGLGSSETSSLISEYLPKVIDKLSPEGEISEHQDLVSAGMELLKGKLFG